MMVALRESCAVCNRLEGEHAGLIHPFTPENHRRTACAECGSANVGRHRRACSQARTCAECGSANVGRHRRTCSQARACAECGSANVGSHRRGVARLRVVP